MKVRMGCVREGWTRGAQYQEPTSREGRQVPDSSHPPHHTHLPWHCCWRCVAPGLQMEADVVWSQQHGPWPSSETCTDACVPGVAVLPIVSPVIQPGASTDPPPPLTEAWEKADWPGGDRSPCIPSALLAWWPVPQGSILHAAFHSKCGWFETGPPWGAQGKVGEEHSCGKCSYLAGVLWRSGARTEPCRSQSCRTAPAGCGP